MVLLRLALMSLVLTYVKCDQKWDDIFESVILSVNPWNKIAFPDVTQMQLYYQIVSCYKCDLMLLMNISNKDVNITRYHPNYPRYFEVRAINNNGDIEIICPKFEYLDIGELGEYELNIGSKGNCRIIQTKKPNNITLHFIIACIVSLVLIVMSNLLEKYYTRIRKFIVSKFNRVSAARVSSDATDEIRLESMNAKEDTTLKASATSKKRLNSLDVFRGITITLMVASNYTYFTYRFLYHPDWHGGNLSSMIFPWFAWIMGFSIPVSIKSLKTQSTPNLKIFWKISWRTIKLFIIGIILNANYEFSFYKFRVFGVLQRLALCYFAIAVLELAYYKKLDKMKYAGSKLYYFSDLIHSWKQSICVTISLITWFLIVYLLPVPGCPTGYMGAGGYENGGKYSNCTGGATGYVDKVILGTNHIYNLGTPRIVYGEEVALYDPEGILGTLTAIVGTYFGTIAGRVFMFYEKPKQRVVIWFIWSIVNFLLLAILTQFDFEHGLVPVNKNIWTFSFVTLASCTAFFIQLVLYVVIDVLKLWNGNPFFYTGTNSILVYILMNLFVNTFPIQFRVSYLHGYKLITCVYAIVLFHIICAYLYYKKMFLQL
jgi:heparan-alpha-glucosaminide N-acetyltransferase